MPFPLRCGRNSEIVLTEHLLKARVRLTPPPPTRLDKAHSAFKAAETDDIK